MDIRWTMVVGRYVRFYSYVNWYFSGLDEKNLERENAVRVHRFDTDSDRGWYRNRFIERSLVH